MLSIQCQNHRPWMTLYWLSCFGLSFTDITCILIRGRITEKISVGTNSEDVSFEAPKGKVKKFPFFFGGGGYCVFFFCGVLDEPC